MDTAWADEMTLFWIRARIAELRALTAIELVRRLLAATWRRCLAPLASEHRRTRYARTREAQSMLVLLPVSQ